MGFHCYPNFGNEIVGFCSDGRDAWSVLLLGLRFF